MVPRASATSRGQQLAKVLLASNGSLWTSHFSGLLFNDSFNSFVLAGTTSSCSTRRPRRSSSTSWSTPARERRASSAATCWCRTTTARSATSPRTAPSRHARSPPVMRLRSSDPSTDRERAVIERQVTHLSRLVDDLLDVSRATMGKIDLRRERLDLAMGAIHMD